MTKLLLLPMKIVNYIILRIHNKGSLRSFIKRFLLSIIVVIVLFIHQRIIPQGIDVKGILLVTENIINLFLVTVFLLGLSGIGNNLISLFNVKFPRKGLNFILGLD